MIRCLEGRGGGGEGRGRGGGYIGEFGELFMHRRALRLAVALDLPTYVCHLSIAHTRTCAPIGTGLASGG